MDSIIQLIQTVGFPIACCVLLAFYIKKISTEYREDVKAITDEYKDAIKDFQKTLEKNTNVLTELNIRLQGSNEKGSD